MERLRARWMEGGSPGVIPVLPEIDAASISAARWKQPAAVRRPGARPRPGRGMRALRFLAMSVAVLAGLRLAGSLAAAGARLLGGPRTPLQLSDLLQLSGDGERAAAARYSSEPRSAPKLIPRILHQTYKTRAVPPEVGAYMRTWREANPGWEVRFYDDQDCLDFVRREFPEYMDAYRRLRKDVERSDFFRYMVVLRHGGVYADIDTECRRPLDEVLRSRDTLVAGWENEFPSAEAAVGAW
jgi:hypothetical protein